MRWSSWIVGLAAGMWVSPALGQNMGTAVTYQGRLVHMGTPVDGVSCTLTFKVYDALSAGSQIGVTQTKSVMVTDGLCVVRNLDFGSNVFTGDKRWLDITVNCGNPGDPETLSPRQELTPTPYALALPGVLPDTSTGKVGIGTVSPREKLEVGGDALIANNGVDVKLVLSRGATNTNAKLVFSNNDSNSLADFQWGLGLTGATFNDLVLTDFTAPDFSARYAMFFKAGGSVGIGRGLAVGDNYSISVIDPPANGMIIEGTVGIATNFPDVSSALTVNGNISIPWGSQIRTANTDHDGRILLDMGWDGTLGDYVDFYAPGDGPPNLCPQIRISDRKGVNIDPTDVNDGTLGADIPALRFGSGDSGEGIASKRTAGAGQFGLGFHTAFVERMSITQSGNIGIGTTTPSQKLYVVGNICATGTIGACSDARFKENIAPLDHALDKIERLRGVAFDWKRRTYPDHQFSAERQVGLIAQDVQEIMPEVVSQGSDGSYSVDYGRLTPVLVEALRDLCAEKNAQIAAMDCEIEELRAQLAELRQLVSDVATINAGDRR